MARWTQVVALIGKAVQALTFPTCLLIFADASAQVDKREATPTRVVAVAAKSSDVASTVVITGDVRPRFQSDVSFRTSGKISARLVDVGAHVRADQVLATLDGKEQTTNVGSAVGVLSSAEALLVEAKMTFGRQQELIIGRHTTQPAFDQARQILRTSQARVDAAKASLGTTKEQLAYTELRAGVAGIITARSAEVGQVMNEGNRVFTIAHDGARDAVFNVHEALFAGAPLSARISLVLQSDRQVTAIATVREVSPTVDSATGVVEVKATIEAAPPAMTLGSVVIGSGGFQSSPAVTLPWSALFMWDGQAAVWLVDLQASTVSPRRIAVGSYAGNGMVLSNGVLIGDRVVTEGGQFLRPGQKVAVVEGDFR